MFQPSVLTPFGMLHTLISLVAVAIGLVALAASGRISVERTSGKCYVVLTAISCVTGLFIFHHGGFGKPHVLAILTLWVIGFVMVAALTNILGRWSERIQVVGLSTTVFFHFIPGVTETLTRVPVGKPLFDHPDAPGLQAIIGILFMVYLVGVIIQLRSLRSTRPVFDDVRPPSLLDKRL